MKLRLYHYWRSSSSYRVRFALGLKGIAFESAIVNLLTEDTESPEFRKRNPAGQVPVIELQDGPDAGKFIAESMAIMEWLEETQPKPALLPGTALDRARIRQLAEIVNSGTQPLHNLTVFQHHSPEPAEQRRWNQHWIRNGMQAYETVVRETAGKFSMGDSPTLADTCLVPQCYAAERFDVPLSDYPTIARINANLLALPSCQAAHPDRFKPAGP